eukprot:CAMPEP_0197418454 /NCGR_PEP_ID=MMETSP1170-20131217/4171_1 /TAXON_ID=54406 /ORGANISM="Sarcinochrysis sp, Strain CCMP770" /LENGTH=45 /DNA_ID= /DNA_START= /DNA_END= /DNA_ORIENTATION=
MSLLQGGLTLSGLCDDDDATDVLRPALWTIRASTIEQIPAFMAVD